MGEVAFYHLTTSPLEDSLPKLLERCRAQGWSVHVRGTTKEAMAVLDKALWAGPPVSFLPHGMAGGEHDAHQPILLTVEGDGTDQTNADCFMVVHGAQVSAEEVTRATRVFILFDGHDGEALSLARAQWKTLTDAGCAAKYWSQETGSWEMKAERAGAGDG